MGKSHETRKAEIVGAALDLAAEVGVAGATTQAIADRLGIAQATVFKHFARKTDIFHAAMEAIGAEVFAALEPHFSSAGPADRRLRAVIAAHLAVIATRRGIPRLLFSDRLHLEDPALKSVALRVMKRYAGRLAGLLREGVEDGSFRRDLAADDVAVLIVTLIQGAVLRWSLCDFDFQLDQQADPVWSFLWPVIRPDGDA
ncbi:MAG: TetR/AcrR family transcriptional regulator [Rhodospirillales bacterium]|nr:TetR/AcrR family transcriptional regulator [Rhodospirillales bacterium]